MVCVEEGKSGLSGSKWRTSEYLSSSFYLLLSVIKGSALRLAHMLKEKLLKQPAVAIRRRLEFIHSPRRKSDASISVTASMEKPCILQHAQQAFLYIPLSPPKMRDLILCAVLLPFLFLSI